MPTEELLSVAAVDDVLVIAIRSFVHAHLHLGHFRLSIALEIKK